MRRKDRQMTQDFGLALVDRAEYGVLSFTGKNGEPHALPLSLARQNQTLFFHSSVSGEKVELIEDGMPVTVVFVSDVRVPSLYSNQELAEISKDARKIAQLGSKIFTTEFASTIVRGRIFRVENDESKIKALHLIAQRFVPDKMPYFESAVSKALPITTVYKIEIDALSAKRKKYDTNRNEMKSSQLEP